MIFKAKAALASLCLAAAFAADPAAASSQGPGLASSISTGSDGSVWFSHSGSRIGSLPSCADPNGVWLFNVNTPGGQAMLANLLSATASGKAVSIVGSGTCTSGHEAVVYIVGP